MKNSDFIRLITKIAMCLTIAPFFDTISKKLLKPTTFKCYAVILTLCVIFSTTWSIFQRMQIGWFTLSTHQFFDYAIEINLVVIFLLCTLGSTFWHNKNWKMFFNNVEYLNKNLVICSEATNKICTYIKLQMIVGHLFFAISVLLQMYLWISLNPFDVYITYICHHVLLYYVFYSTVFINTILLLLKRNYNSLGSILSPHSIVEEIRKVSFLYRILGDAVDLFNKIFGLHYLVVVGYSLLSLLSCVDFIATVDYLVEDKKLQLLVIVSYASFALFVLTTVTIVTLASEWVTDAAKDIESKCYVLQENFKSNSDERQELLNLAKMVHAKIPISTAAGFFDINKGTLLSVFGTAITYLIVIVQVNGSRTNSSKMLRK